jgi:glycosyltransferase involved in cell wall biosynthesis
MRKLVIASNMYNEIEQLPEWFDNFTQIADGGILIVDTGSNDGTQEFCRERGAVVVVDDIIRREGYGPARNHLRVLSAQHFPGSLWMAYFDADERIDEEEFHQLRYLKDYLQDFLDVIAFPRIDWMDKKRTSWAKDWRIQPDYQARMSRLDKPIKYIRRLHEQITGYQQVYARLTNPKINHFHRSTDQDKRDEIGKLCAKLHMEDKEFGHSVPEHPKEAMYRERYIKEGLK